MAQPFIPAAKAQPNAVSNTPEVPKSSGGQGVKSSTPDGWTCFRCKQPGHLKKDCPEQPYCSRCHTRGHIPAKCPTENQGNLQQGKMCKNGKQQMNEGCGSEHKISPSFQTQTTDVSTVQATMDAMLFNLSNKDLKSCYRCTMQDTSHSMNWYIKALLLKVMDPRFTASITPTLYMRNLVMRWKGGSTRGYPKTYRRHLRGPWTLNPGSLPSNAYIPGKSMRSTTLMSAVTIRSLRSMRLNMSKTLIIKVRITIQITKEQK